MVADWRQARGSRRELLERLARVPGVYVPSLFRVHYGADRTVAAIEPLLPGYEKVTRRIVADQNGTEPGHDAPLFQGGHSHGQLGLDVGRHLLAVDALRAHSLLPPQPTGLSGRSAGCR